MYPNGSIAAPIRSTALRPNVTGLEVATLDAVFFTAFIDEPTPAFIDADNFDKNVPPVLAPTLCPIAVATFEAGFTATFEPAFAKRDAVFPIPFPIPDNNGPPNIDNPTFNPNIPSAMSHSPDDICSPKICLVPSNIISETPIETILTTGLSIIPPSITLKKSDIFI